MQFPKWKLPKYVLAAAQVPVAFSRRSARPLPHPSFSTRPLKQPVAAPQKAKPNIGEVAAWEIAHLGSRHFKKKSPLRKLHWEKHLEKY